MSGRPRRRPYPCDVNLAGVGLMLGRPQQGAPLVSKKVQPFDQQSPTAYRYDTQNPAAERAQPYDDLTLGFGLKTQRSFNDKKYRYALGVDCSIGGLIQKGPDITAFTPGTTDATNGVVAFFEIGGNLFAAAGRYVLQRVSDGNWSVAKDFGVGQHALNVATFTSSGSGTTYAFAALAGANNAQYSTDGITWTAFATFQCLDFIRVGVDFYRASDTNQLSKVDTNADPTTEANWTNANSFRVGDKSAAIVRLATDAVGSLLIFKANGIYTIDDSGQDHQLYKFLEFGTGLDDGRFWGSFGNDTHVSYGNNHYRLVPTATISGTRIVLQEIGPEKLTAADTVKGRVTAFVADGAKRAYAGVYDDDTGNGWLAAFGAWMTPEIADGQLDEAKRIDAWHGALSQTFTGQKITALWKSATGAASGHSRLYVGFSDGSLAWFALPCVPNPAGCSAYRYSTTDGHLYLPLWHGTFQADAKTLRGISVIATHLTVADHLTAEYKTDPTAGSYTAFATTFNSAPRQRADFPNNTASYLADLDVVLTNSATTSSPLVQAVVLHHAVRPALVETFTFSVLASDGLVKRDGSPLRIGADQIRSTVQGTAAALGSVTVILPDETSQQLSVLDYGESYAWDERTRQWRASLDVTAVQYTTNTVYGTWDRVAAYSWDQIAGMTWDSIQGL